MGSRDPDCLAIEHDIGHKGIITCDVGDTYSFDNVLEVSSRLCEPKKLDLCACLKNPPKSPFLIKGDFLAKSGFPPLKKGGDRVDLDGIDKTANPLTAQVQKFHKRLKPALVRHYCDKLLSL